MALRNCEIMDMHGFMPSWGSRDWVERLSCSNRRCYLYSGGGSCVSPSAVVIDKTGACELFQKSLEEKKKIKSKRQKKDNRAVEFFSGGLGWWIEGRVQDK